MGNGNRKKLRVSFWGKLCAAVMCAVVMTTYIGGEASLVSAASSSVDSAIASLQAESERLKKENEKRKNQINAISGDISGNKEAIQLVTDQINGIKEEISAAEELITKKDELISERSAQIGAVILTIDDKEKEIKDKLLMIDDLREENKQNLQKFASLARAMYMTNSSDMIPVLNGSDDWYNFFVYSDVVKNISGQNAAFMKRLQNRIQQQETLIEELDASIAQLQIDKDNLEKERAEYEKQRAELDREKTELNAYAEQQYAYLSELAAKSTQLQAQLDSLQIKISQDEKQIEKNNAEIDRIIREAQEANKGQTVYNDGFLWPVSSQFRNITTKFGYSAFHKGLHAGIDIVGGQIGGSNIYAAQSGTVIVASNSCPHLNPKDPRINNAYDGCGGGYGNYIVVDHGGGVTTLYAHCASLKVKKGQHVNKGDAIGIVGSSGWSTGYHLHFEVRANNTRKDPLSYTYQYK